jgi:TnpA family transposase
VLVAQACNVGLTPLVNAARPALTRGRLVGVTQGYLHPGAIAAANARIVAYHAGLQLARAWGGGEVASVDGMRFTVPARTIHAGYSRRYFHRRRGVTALGTTSDQYTGLATIVITGTQSEAIYLLDSLLDPQTELRPREVMSDTAGATDQVFGLFRLLGYQFSPRLADAGGARFWRLDPAADYCALNTVARHRIDRRLVCERYDELLRVAGSLVQGHTTASALMRALRGRSREAARLARAIGEVGRVAKTIHLLGYLMDEGLRRRIHTQLGRGEGRHALAREVFHGRRGHLHQAYRDGQEEQLGALGLVVNCIVLWNTIYVERSLDHLRAEGLAVRDEDVERLSPLGHEHINLVGRYRMALAESVRRGSYRELNKPEELVA